MGGYYFAHTPVYAGDPQHRRVKAVAETLSLPLVTGSPGTRGLPINKEEDRERARVVLRLNGRQVDRIVGQPIGGQSASH
jgi:hypothetical protein